MIIKEFISETNKNQMISTLLKYYKVDSVKLRYKSMKDYAHFDVDRGTLQLSTKYKSVKPNQIKDFLITILHEIYHAMDAKKYGWKKFKEMYEREMNYQISQGKHQYRDNQFELEAEKFGQGIWEAWKRKFKKEGLI